MESPAQLARDNTMETTAKEGIKFLEKTSPELAEECKTVAKENVQNGSGDAPEVVKNGSSPVKLPRDNTMVTTAQEGKEFLEKQGGVNEEAKTRSQEAELNSSTNGEEEKTATKRSAEEAEESKEVEEPKKQKTEEEVPEQKEEDAANGEKKSEEPVAAE